MRLFIALDIPKSVCEGLTQKVEQHKSLSSLRWLPPSGWHLTLKFLGDISEDTLSVVEKTLLETCVSFDSISLRIKSAGVFPNKKSPRVFWTGIEGEIEKITLLANTLNVKMASLGFPSEERNYFPHLTLARSKKETNFSQGVKVAQQFCTLFSPYESEEFSVNQFHLYRSHLQHSGVRYEVCKSFPLRFS